MINEDFEEIAPKKSIVYRKGKRTVKMECPPGYIHRDGNCIKMSPSEKAKRRAAAKKARKAANTTTAKQSRAKSLAKRLKANV